MYKIKHFSPHFMVSNILRQICEDKKYECMPKKLWKCELPELSLRIKLGRFPTQRNDKCLKRWNDNYSDLIILHGIHVPNYHTETHNYVQFVCVCVYS